MTDLERLQEDQAVYDIECWDVNTSPRDKIRHIEHHLAKKLGTLAGLIEATEHGAPLDFGPIVSEIIPDLQMYSMQLANEAGANIEELWRKRLAENKKRIDTERQTSG